MTTPPSIVWLSQDLRLADHAALHETVRRGGPVIPVYIWSPGEEGEWAPGTASRWWLKQSLARLDEDLRQRGSRLVVRRGESLEVLRAMIDQTHAGAVFWQRRIEPARRKIEESIERALASEGIEAQVFHGATLFDPAALRTQQGKPYTVFTPFWKAAQVLAAREPLASPLPAPRRIPAPDSWPDSLPLERLDDESAGNWAGGWSADWTPGEAGAQAQLKRFLGESLPAYPLERERPDHQGTSHLSPHLHFGELSPRQLWHAVRRREETSAESGMLAGAEAFLRQLAWREFAYALLYHFPHTAVEPLRERFAAFPWELNEKALTAWQRGQTGYPLVDAGLRQLRASGWMHNRARMIAASFLVKNLLIPWQEGAHWFWDTLVDADLACNTLGWQWVAGCGADAAPFFRIFNPVLQGTKFDPAGDYVRRWVPELAALPARWIHEPWRAPAGVLAKARIKLGETYPRPVAESGASRTAALRAYATLTGKRGQTR